MVGGKGKILEIVYFDSFSFFSFFLSLSCLFQIVKLYKLENYTRIIDFYNRLGTFGSTLYIVILQLHAAKGYISLWTVSLLQFFFSLLIMEWVVCVCVCVYYMYTNLYSFSFSICIHLSYHVPHKDIILFGEREFSCGERSCV